MATPASRPVEDLFIVSGSQWAKRMVALAAGLGMFLAALDISLNVALPAITRYLETDLQTVQWTIVVFIATRAGLVMGVGSFADRFGLRRVYLFGAVTYLVAMFCIALSPTLEIVVGFRVLQALGTGCLYAASPAIMARLFPASSRGLGMGFTTASQALGMLVGTLGAGLLVQWFDWQAVFLGRVPFALLAIVLGFWWMDGRPRANSGPAFDVIGAVSLTAALFCLVIGLRLGRSVGWTSPAVLVLLLLAPVFLATFWKSEGKAPWPILPRELLLVPGFAVSSLSMFLAHLGVFVIWFIFPFYVGDSMGRGALSLGMMLAVMAALNIVFSGVGGWLCDRAGPMVVGTAGLVVMSGGLLYMGYLEADSSLDQVGLRIAMVGAGLGLFQSAAYALMMSSVPAERFGTAAGALSLSQALGTVLSVAVIGGIFAASNQYHLGGLLGTGLSPAEMGGRAFMLAFRDVFWLGAALNLAGAGTFLLSRLRSPAPSMGR